MTTCKGCGATIHFGRTADGKTIPLDPRPPVYRVKLGTRPLEVERVTDSYVSHFATCPRANDFSSSKRKRDSAHDPEKITDEELADRQQERERRVYGEEA